MERVAEQLSARGVVGGLEAAEHLVQRVEHLLGELLADLVLELAAVVEQRAEPLLLRKDEQPLLAEQQAHRRADRAARGLRHRPDLELQPAGALAARRRDEPQDRAVEEQASWDAGLAEQAFHATVRRGFEQPTAA